MSLSKLNIFIQNSQCRPLSGCWWTQMVIQTCGGEYLVDYWPEVIKQLQHRYGNAGYVDDSNDWTTTVDHGGQILEVIVDGGATQTITFTSPADTIYRVMIQMQTQLTGCTVSIVDGHLRITSNSAGPQSSVAIGAGGTCTIPWHTPVNGTGHLIEYKPNYCGYTRIAIKPPSGQFINHIEVDVPPGCYKIWTRVCFGGNEETNRSLVIATSGIHKCVYLLLDAPNVCGGELIHPGMDVAINNFQFPNEQLIPFVQIFAKVAQRPKAVLQEDLNNRLAEAQLLNDPALIARIEAVRNIVDQIPPECY